MLHTRFLVGTPFLYVLIIFWSAITFTSLDERWTAEAAPSLSLGSASARKLHHRINNNIPGPPESDYPSDEVIYITCGELGRDQSVMFTEIGDSFPAKYFAVLNNKKIYTDLFPEDPEPFTKMLWRSLKWYQDFADRYSRIYAERCSGDVFLVSNWPRGPVSRCSVWYRIEFPVLKMNPAVERVILVDKLNYGNQVEIWPVDRRPPEDQGGDEGGGDEGPGGPPRNPLEPGPNRPRLPGVTPVGGGAAFGLLLNGGLPALGTLVVPALGSVELPPLPSPSDTPQYNPDGENLQDVVYGDQASLPGADWNTFTGDGSLDGFDVALLPQESDGATVDSSSSPWSAEGDSTDLFATDTNLFSGNDVALAGRGFPILVARDGETCFDWAGNGDDPALAQSNRGDNPILPQGDQGGKAQWASIHVVQHRGTNEAGTSYTFDLSVFEGGITKLASEDGLIASPGEWVSILSPLAYRVYVKAGHSDEDPLQFRYGLSEWDSNDVETHDCHVDEWKGEYRTGDCNFAS